jgi:dephospho-CoA kinase
MRIIGLTGGIASGKSTIARLLEKMGASVIDADQLSRDAVIPGSMALSEIAEEFGPSILNQDGTLNRAALGKIIFADPDSRHLLEAITHPAIASLARERLDSLERKGVEVAVYMAPLLVEAGVSGRVDEIWVVFVDTETQVMRLMARDGISREEALQRINSQMPMEEKRHFGKVVIDNRGSLDDAERQVRAAWEREVLNRYGE